MNIALISKETNTYILTVKKVLDYINKLKGTINISDISCKCNLTENATIKLISCFVRDKLIN